MTWLLVLHASGPSDLKCIQRSLRTLGRHILHNGGSKSSFIFFIALFGPTIKSANHLFKCYNHNNHINYLLLRQSNPNLPIQQQIQYLMSDDHISVNHRIRAILFSGHGSGWVLGNWRPKQPPFITLEEFNNLILNKFKPKLMVWNTCMAGTMAAIYGLPKFVKIVVASPALHPYVDIFATKAFAKAIEKHMITKQDCLKVALSLIPEWHHQASFYSPNRCLFVFDVDQVKKLASDIKKLWPQLIFDKRSQLHRKDANLFDLWTSARNLPLLQHKIMKCILNHNIILNNNDSKNNKKTCCYPCKRSRGISIESHYPRKWIDIYEKTRWVQFLKWDKIQHNRDHPKPLKKDYNNNNYNNNNNHLLLPPNLTKKRKKKK